MESHQPPLYYVLAAIVYKATAPLGSDSQFLSLRLFSVALGAAVLLAVYHLVRNVDPEHESLALVASAGIAVVPMHIAMSAAINNDTLAELLLLLILVQSVRAARTGFSSRSALTVGLFLGLALLTKTTVYMAVAVVGLSWLCSTMRAPGAQRSSSAVRRNWIRVSAIQALQLFLPALVLTTPWLVRNLLVYGNWDLLGWVRHDSIVSGQLRSAELLSQIGWLQFVLQFLTTTFRSFWGQFGWMGVLIDQRLYLALALLSTILATGLTAFAARAWRGRAVLTAGQARALLILAASALLTVATYLWYNTKFVQHQGRYLFPALGPFALAAALGLRELVGSRLARLLAVAFVLGAGLLAVAGLALGDVHVWRSVLLLAAGTFAGALGWLPARWQWLPLAALYVAFLALDWVCLFGFIVPALT